MNNGGMMPGIFSECGDLPPNLYLPLLIGWGCFAVLRHEVSVLYGVSRLLYMFLCAVCCFCSSRVRKLIKY